MPASVADIEMSRLIANSLDQGDHLDLSRLRLRGAAGLATLAIGYLRRVSVVPQVSGIVLIAANGVSHGARLVNTVRQSVATGLKVLSDQRLTSELSVDLDFPSLAVRSIGKIVTKARLRGAVKLRFALGAEWRWESRIYGEYLFLAQALRFLAIREILAEAPKSSLILTDFDRLAYTAPWVLVANELGLRTATLVHGSPNRRNYVPVNAKNILVWGDTQARWFTKYDSGSQVHVVGRTDLRQKELRGREGLGRLVICHSRETLSISEEKEILDYIRRASEANETVVLRLHPSSSYDTLEGAWLRIASASDTVVRGGDELTEFIRTGDELLSCESSSAIDALSTGVSVIVVADSQRELPADLERIASETQNLPLDSVALARLKESILAYTGADAQTRLAEVLKALSAN